MAQSQHDVYCRQCVLPRAFPGADVDASGLCTFCRRPGASGADHERQQARMRARFTAFCDTHRGRQPYDCLLAWSGGKDSTYTLALLRQRYDLRVLAYTFDNGFVSPRALDNMRQVADALDVDHIIVRPRFDVLRTIFRQAAERPDVYPVKALTRTSSVCNACMGLAKGIGAQLALGHGVPMVAYGWSPGQAPLASALFARPIRLYRPMVEALASPLRRLTSVDIAPYFPTAEDWARVETPPCDVAPLLLHPYDEPSVVAAIEALGWRRPTDTDPNSSNCLLNAYGNATHRARYGFHPYALEMANLVRQGIMERSEALARLEAPEDPAVLTMVQDRLGVERFASCQIGAVGAPHTSVGTGGHRQ